MRPILCCLQQNLPNAFRFVNEAHGDRCVEVQFLLDTWCGHVSGGLKGLILATYPETLDCLAVQNFE